VAAMFVIPTYFAIPPFSNAIDLNEKMEDRHERVYAIPP
jgi:hypothetical protein